jgi:hypothetical protein
MNPETVNKQEETVKAKFLNRFIARCIDLIIIGALLEIIPRAGFYAGIAYLLIADGLFEGRSVGKKLIGLKVVIFGSITPCGYKESIIRNFPFAIGYLLFGFSKGIPLLGEVLAVVFPVLILSLESLIILGNDRGMRFGDEIAKTQVIEDKKGGVDVQ